MSDQSTDPPAAAPAPAPLSARDRTFEIWAANLLLAFLCALFVEAIRISLAPVAAGASPPTNIAFEAAKFLTLPVFTFAAGAYSPGVIQKFKGPQDGQ